jgi:hypothetical protein
MHWSYENALTGDTVSQAQTFDELDSVPNAAGTLQMSDSTLEKSVMLVQMVKMVKESLKAYEALRCDVTPPPPCRPGPLHPCPLPSLPRRDCTEQRAKLAETLATNLKSLEQRYAGSPFLRDGSEVNEAIDIFTTLSENMKKPPESNRSPPRHRRHGFDASRQPSSVTAGGAQDFGHFKLIVKNGGVPQSEAFCVFRPN